MSRGAPGPVGAADLADIRDLPGGGPQNALAGERQLAMGALAPDTATSLPTLMVLALLLLALGALAGDCEPYIDIALAVASPR